MAKRKTIEEKELDKIMTETLDKAGRKITVVAARNSKVSKLQKDHLRDSLNWRVRPADTLTVSQKYYGKFNTPKGKSTPKDRSNIEDTPLKNAIKEFVPEAKNIYVQGVIDVLKKQILTNK